MFLRDKKIDFTKEMLVSCKLAVFVDSTIWLSFDEPKILIKGADGFYYDPWYYGEKYQKGYSSLKRGEKFVEKTDNIPIQELKEISLTKKELKTKKIALKRLKEIEQHLKNEI